MKPLKNAFTILLSCITSNRVITRAVSFILTLSLLFCSLPLAVYADEIESLNRFDGSIVESVSMDTAADAVAVGAPTDTYEYDSDVYEVEELREVSVKHFRLEDGSYVAAQYGYPVHYYDDNGVLTDIDNTLAEDGSGFITNSTARIKFQKKITGNESLFTLHDGNTKLTLSLKGAKKGTLGSITNYSDEDSDTKLGKLMNLEKLTSSVKYENILDGVDIEYVVESHSVKENIIVKEPQDSYTYTFELKLNNLSARAEDDGSVSIVNDGGEVVYIIPAPIAFDSVGAYTPAGTATQTLEGKNGKYTLTVSVDPEWMSSEERAYPITVDPAIIKAGEEYTMSYNYNDEEILGNNLLFVGYPYAAVHVFKSIPSIPEEAYIADAYFHLTLKSSHNETGIYAMQIKSDWGVHGYLDNTLDPIYFPDYEALNDTVVLDFKEHDGSNYSWNITEAMDDWYAGKNYGLLFIDASGGGGYEFYTSSAANVANVPALTIYYSTQRGLESYWPYLTQEMGSAGTVNTSLSTGQMVLSIPTLSTTDALFGYTPSLIYNSSLYNVKYTSDTVSMLPNSISNLANGFTLDSFEYVREIWEGGYLTWYEYLDGDGTPHFFNEINGVFIDEDGLCMRLTATDDEIQITDDSKITKHFVKVEGTNVSRLIKITDANDNSININHNAFGFITDITFSARGKAAIEMLTFGYHSTTNALMYICSTHTKRALIFRYSNNPTSTLSATGSNYLRQIDYIVCDEEPNAELLSGFFTSSVNNTGINIFSTANYTYTEDGRISSVSDSNSFITYEYTWNDGRITKIGKIHTQYDAQLSFQEISYSENYTDVVYPSYSGTVFSGDSSYYEDSELLVSRTVFDNFGRVMSTYNAKKDWSEIYGGKTVSYSKKDLAKNSVSQIVDLIKPTPNYIYDSGFECFSGTSNYVYWNTSNTTSVTNVSASYTTYFSEVGDYSMQIAPTVGTTAYAEQEIKLQHGDYTLSFPYYSIACNAVSARVVILCDDASRTELASEEICLDYTSGNETDTGFFSMHFSLEDSDSYAYNFEPIILRIEVTAASNMTTQGKLYIDEMMLEDGTNVSPRNLVDMCDIDYYIYGYHEDIYVEDWQLTEDVRNQNYLVDIPIDGEYVTPCEERVYSYTISDEELSSLVESGGSNSNRKFIVSGMGKSGDAFASAVFGIRVDIYYYQGPSEDSSYYETVVRSHRFSFLTDCDDWQFIGGMFSTEFEGEDTVDEDGLVIEDTNSYDIICGIAVVCEAEGAPDGTALFSNISLVECDASSYEKYEYNDDGLVSKKSNLNYSEYYEYNDDRNVVLVANDHGELTTYAYEDDVNPNLVTTVIEYDFTYNGTLVYPAEEENAASLVVKTPRLVQTSSYTNYGQLEITQTAAAAVAEDGTVTQSTEQKYYTKYTYDNNATSYIFGSLRTESDGVDRIIASIYDPNTGLLLARTNKYDNSGECYEYDIYGNLISVKPAKYDLASSYIPVTGSNFVYYEYDGMNRLVGIETDNNVYYIGYDIYGNPCSINATGTGSTQYEYDEMGNLLSEIIYDNGFGVEYLYNDLALVTEIWYNGGEGSSIRFIAFEYDYTFDGQVSTVIDHLSKKKTVYRYDATGALTYLATYDTDDAEIEVSQSLTYNDKNEISKILSVIRYGTDAQRITDAYTYYDDGKIKRHAVLSADANNSVSAYTYDDYGRLTVVNNMLCNSTRSSRFYLKTSYTYRTFNAGLRTDDLVTGYTNTLGSVVSSSFTYSYDRANNITKIVDSSGNEIRYYYDDLQQLVREDNEPRSITYLYTYDTAGNLTTKQICQITAEGEEPTTVGSTKTYTYNGDRLVSYNGTSITYDALGNPLSYYNGNKTYSFGWSGRILHSATVGTKTYSMRYNDEGIRVSKKVNNTTTNYYLSGSRILAEETNGNITVYLYDASGSPMGMQYHGRLYADGVWDIFWYEKNLQGDIIAVYDKDGTKLVSYLYNAWGDTYYSYSNGGGSTAAVNNPFRYRGYYYDVDLGLYYLQSRYYDANTGRFISPDDVTYLGANGDLNSYNLYAYCSNNPVMYTDPSGHAILALILGITALVGMGMTIGGVASDNNTLTAIGLTMVAVPALISGVGAIASGATYLGMIGGGAAIAGIGSGIFASAEYQEAFTGNNWILNFGMNEGLYNSLLISFAATATIGTLTCGVLTGSGKMSTQGQMFRSMENHPNRWKTVKELTSPATGKRYKGGISTYTNYINKWTGAKGGIHKILKFGKTVHYHFHRWIL